jgi:hypothetical protein
MEDIAGLGEETEASKYLFAYARRLASTAHLKNWFNITQGDINRTLDITKMSLNAFATWRRTNHLVALFEKHCIWRMALLQQHRATPLLTMYCDLPSKKI